MERRIVQIALLIGCLAMLQNMAVIAQDSGPNFSLSTGVEFASGNYGGDVDIEDIYIPFTATVDYEQVTFRITVPYLSVSGPEGTIFDSGGEPLPGSGASTTESGLGDVIGSITFYDVFNSQRLGLAIDLTGKIKFASADEEKGLGTGENDYSVQMDLYKFMKNFTLLSSVGYKLRGDPAGIDLDDVLTASVGGTYKFNPDVNGGMIFDYRESAIIGGDSIQELTGFISRRLSEDWRFQVYLLTGFTNSSPDWGGGVQIKRILQR